ncbi:pro-neuregulin-4, membrane-bound isoform isoform X2 [Mauremys reevesii]|nr:pro-neuregulin-4, membrane-bound isoform isoform X2 [Mauremys reevesii]
MIPTVSSPFCRCIENYTGARCEEVLLPSLKTQIKSELFAAFLASVVVLGILVIGAFYILCRNRADKATHCVEELKSPQDKNWTQRSKTDSFSQDRWLKWKAHIRRASSTERGASLVETTSSNGCNKITE